MRQVYRHRQHDDEIMEILLDDGGDPAEHEPPTAVIRQETSDQVRSCVDNLAPAARRLVTARYFDGQSVADIAADIGRSPNWVSVNLMRCRQTLGKCLRAQGVEL